MDLADNSIFQQFITFVIVLAGVTVGIGTDDGLTYQLQGPLDFIDTIIQWVFVFELVLKMSCFELKPLEYFNDNWNKVTKEIEIVLISSFISRLFFCIAV
jgi:hypothetical protein